MGAVLKRITAYYPRMRSSCWFKGWRVGRGAGAKIYPKKYLIPILNLKPPNIVLKIFNLNNNNLQISKACDFCY